MDYFADQAGLIAVKTEIGAKTIYRAIQTATVQFPSAFTLATIFYNSILDNPSKDKISNFIKDDIELGKYHTKYIIVTTAMESEKTDDMEFFRKNEALVKSVLTMIGINTDGISIDDALNQVNGHVQGIIDLIKKYKEDLKKILSVANQKGGKTKRKRKKTKQKKTRSRARISF